MCQQSPTGHANLTAYLKDWLYYRTFCKVAQNTVL